MKILATVLVSCACLFVAMFICPDVVFVFWLFLAQQLTIQQQFVWNFKNK